jgi:predicted O-methyltransferase YrrM
MSGHGLYTLMLTEYLESLVPPRPEELARMEEHAREKGFPIIGPVCGQLCYQTARMIGARRVFELGSGFGYSTAWFARAVLQNGGGKVHHVVWDENLSQQARRHLDTLGYGIVVVYHVSEALAALRQEEEHFDLIFCDIDKEAYPKALPLVYEKLRPGGVLIIDNMLWDGRIFNPKNQHPTTVAIRQFTKMITNDERWIITLAPVRDGMIIAYKN